MTEKLQPGLGSGALREALERRIIASLTQYIHQERVRLSGVYSKAFGAKDVKPEEVAKYENQTTATLANAIELIKIEFRDAAELSLSSPIEPGPDIKSLYCEKHQHVAEAAAAGFLSDDCPTCEIQRAEREAKCSNCGNIVLVPTPQAFSEIRELIKEWRAKADYESARWSNQGSSTAQERIDAVGDYYADALEKALAPSRQGAAKRVEAVALKQRGRRQERER